MSRQASACPDLHKNRGDYGSSRLEPTRSIQDFLCQCCANARGRPDAATIRKSAFKLRAGPDEYRVEGSAGLLLHVSPATHGSWVFRYRSPTHSQPRRMGLSAGELGALWRVLDTMRSVSAAFRPKLLTTCRLGEVLGAKAEFDLERSVWNLPSARTKNGKAYEIAPSRSGLANSCAKRRKLPMRALPGEISGKPVRRDRLQSELIALRAALGMASWRSHDLRRTVGDMARRERLQRSNRANPQPFATRRDGPPL